MDKDFRDRLQFSGSNHSVFLRENWRESLALLPEPVVQKPPASSVPTCLATDSHPIILEWVIAEASHATCIILTPYCVNGITRYRIPSFNHLFAHLTLDSFDEAWATYFAQKIDPEEASVVLDEHEPLNDILWALTRARRLRMASDMAPLVIAGDGAQWGHGSMGPILELKARLRHSHEWDLWALDAELLAQTGEVIAPESIDLMTSTGLVVYHGSLYSLPHGTAWVIQLLDRGTWLIAKDSLGEALYQLAQRIHDGDFFRHLSEIHCKQKRPLPVVYLRAKDFEKQASVTLYLAYRYGDSEVFSIGHTQEESNIPIGFEATQTDVWVMYFRDFTSENEAESLMRTVAEVSFIPNKRAWHVNLDALWSLIPILLGHAWEIWAEKQKIEALSSFGIGAESKQGWFELQPWDTQTKQRIDPLQLIRYLKRKSLFIQLGHGRVCVLPERWISHLTKLLDLGQVHAEQRWCFSSIYAPEVDHIIGDEPTFHAEEAFHGTVERLQSMHRVVPLGQPEHLRAMLRPYQLDGLTWLNLLCDLHVGGILADDMGLGKTVQILALIQHRILNQALRSAQTMVVVCPKSVQGHWLTQAQNLVPRLSSRILRSSEVLAGFRPSTQHQLLLVSFGVVRHHIALLARWPIDLLIVDEAQMIKNDTSQTTQAIKQLVATQRFALTGTPIENRFEEFVSIFSFLNPQAQVSLRRSASTVEALQELVQRALHPFVLRRLKEDVLPELPPKVVREVTIPMLPDQARLYQELLAYYRHELVKHQSDLDLPTETETAFILEGLLRLRQVASHPKQLLGDQFQNCSSNKLTYLTENIPILVENGHRIVVFSQFLGFLNDLAQQLDALTIRTCYVDGETVNREQELALFQSNAAIKVLCISLRVGGVGIDLTTTDVCIIADPWWNDAVERQAIDRLHRYGQKKTVHVLRMISEHSIEEKMNVLKQSKSALADALGKTSPDFLQNLEWKDFTEILIG